MIEKWCKRCNTFIKNVEHNHLEYVDLIVLLVIAAIMIIVAATSVRAEVTIDQIANAIYKAENSKNHPYGILKHYKTTTPRQACLNTIEHARRDWNGKGDFIAFLGSRYCPVGAANDLMGLNRNWVRNVKYFISAL